MRSIAMIVAAATLAGCASNSPPPIVPTDVRPLTIAEKAALKKSLSGDMKDPEATQFRWMPIAYASGNTGADYCGMINGKNSYGGYTGFRPFRAAINRNAKGEYDSGTIIRIQADEIGSDAWIYKDLNDKMMNFCKSSGYSDFSLAS